MAGAALLPGFSWKSVVNLLEQRGRPMTAKQIATAFESENRNPDGVTASRPTVFNTCLKLRRDAASGLITGAIEEESGLVFVLLPARLVENAYHGEFGAMYLRIPGAEAPPYIRETIADTVRLKVPRKPNSPPKMQYGQRKFFRRRRVRTGR